MDRILYTHFETLNKAKDYTLRPIIDLIKGGDYDVVIYGNQSEYKALWYEGYLNYGQEFTGDELLNELGCILKERNIEFYLIVGCEYNEVFSNFTTYPIPNFHIVYWSTYLMSHVYNNLIKEYSTHRINKDFKNLMICYNNKSRYHRCEMMDELCKRDLLKDNVYSWIETSKVGHGKQRLGDYTFSCFDDKKVMLDEFNYETNREFTTNILDMKCFVNVVTESDIDALFITEKTYRQLFIGQPFLTLCAKDTHKTLKGYGFELYDEIFDYSFDSEPYYKDRIKGIIDNIERLKGKDYGELYKLIEDKVEHNVRVSYELVSKITGQLPPDLSHYHFLVKDL
jgi:hypothetical protein